MARLDGTGLVVLRTCAVALAVGMLGFPAAAGGDVDRSKLDRGDVDWADQLSRAVELPAHRWLKETREAASDGLASFTTDGCSGGMSSMWTFTAGQFPAFAKAHEGVPPWQECCVIHDRAYHAGGDDPAPDASYDARLQADETLRACVMETASERDEVLMAEYGMTPEQVRKAYAAIAAAMFQAVRLGGGPCTGLPWRWGYGWPQCWKEQDG